MELIGDLLDLEKLDSGKLVLQPACASAYDICSAAKDAVEHFAQRQQIKLIMPEGDAAIYGDERRLIQVVINLLSNAIKFSPRGANVSMKIAPAGNLVEISVIDQGAGIPEQDQEVIFERFRQSTSKTDSGVKGTGLGLAIVKAIGEAHNGQVGVESKLGEGSRFWMKLPAFTGGDES
jgi:signal transduction histidine kinase